MDVDDLALPDRLARQYEFLERNRDIGVVGSNYFEIDDNGRQLGEIILPEGDEDIRRKILRINPFNHSAVLIRKKAFDSVGPYDERFTYAQDYELWFRFLRKYKGHNIQEKLMMKRNPLNSITVSRKRIQIGYTLRALNAGRKHFRATLADNLQYLKYAFIYFTPQLVLNGLRKIKNKSRQDYYVVKL
jgi:hypothetical protein